MECTARTGALRYVKKEPSLSSSAQLEELAKAEKLRRKMHPQFYAGAAT